MTDRNLTDDERAMVEKFFKGQSWDMRRYFLLNEEDVRDARQRNNQDRPSYFGILIHDLTTLAALLFGERDRLRAEGTGIRDYATRLLGERNDARGIVDACMIVLRNAAPEVATRGGHETPHDLERAFFLLKKQLASAREDEQTYLAKVGELDRALQRSRARSAALWTLLDDIDTLDDSCRENDALFRERVRAVQKKRHLIATPDGRAAATDD